MVIRNNILEMQKSIGKSESAKSKTISVRIDPTELNGLLIENPWKNLVYLYIQMYIPRY